MMPLNIWTMFVKIMHLSSKEEEIIGMTIFYDECQRKGIELANYPEFLSWRDRNMNALKAFCCDKAPLPEEPQGLDGLIKGLLHWCLGYEPEIISR